MKEHFAITISDVSGSRHYSVRKSAKRYFAPAVLLFLFVMGASPAYNYTQYMQYKPLHDTNARLADRNAEFSEKVADYDLMVRAIGQELVEIERLSGVETGDGDATLDERIRAVGRFYREKEGEYSEIGERVDQIESMLDPQDGSSDRARQNLADRVNMAAVNVYQEKMLLSNIPSGYPTESRKITSKFGYRTHPVTKVNSFHNGVDLRAKNRQNIRATADGIVRSADYSKLSGNRVIVQHNLGFESYYAHLHKISVRPGDVIYKGDLVGVSGNTGQSNGPHLHYEIRHLGKPIDPTEFLQWKIGTDKIYTQVTEVEWPSLISLISKQITPQTLQLSQLGPVSPERLK